MKKNGKRKNISVVLPDLKGGYDKYFEVIKKGKTVFIEDLTPHPGFGGIHIAVRTFKVCDGLGIITTDITERKRMEEELQKCKAQLLYLLREKNSNL